MSRLIWLLLLSSKLKMEKQDLINELQKQKAAHQASIAKIDEKLAALDNLVTKQTA